MAATLHANFGSFFTQGCKRTVESAKAANPWCKLVYSIAMKEPFASWKCPAHAKVTQQMPSAATRPEDAGQHLQELRAQHARLCQAQAGAINAQHTAQLDSPAAHDAARAIAMADAELIKVGDMIAAAEGLMQVDTAPSTALSIVWSRELERGRAR